MDAYGTAASGAPPESPPASKQPVRQRYMRLWTQLDTEYQSWRTVHEDICNFIQPHRGRFLFGEQNKGTRKDSEIVNDTATDADKKLQAAMDTGITSPAREWFRYSTDDEDEATEEYLHTLQDLTFDVLAKSNFYKTHRQLYGDVVGPATGLMFIEADDEEVIRCIHCPIGTYRLAVDARGRVSVVMRMVSMTAVQIVEKFIVQQDGSLDWSRVSVAVRTAYESTDRKDAWFQVLHVVERRTAREPGKIDKKNKPWASCWMEWAGLGGTQMAGDSASGPIPDVLLEEGGYDEQPFVAPRWDVIGEDAYGKNSPGWQALGDVKGLQSLELSSAKTIAKLVDPPMNATDDLENASLLPGAVNYLSKDKASQFIPAVQIDHETVTVTLEEKREYQRRIERAYLNDILFIITNDQTAGTETAEAVRAKKDERLLQLGGAFGRVADEDLKPAINRVLALMQRHGNLVPLPPPALRQRPILHIDFQNILVAAQKTLGITAIDQAVAGVAALREAGRPDALDNLDPDEITRMRFDMLGVKPNALLSKDQVAQARAQRAKAAAGQARAETVQKTAPALAALSKADPETLQQLLQQYGGAAATQATGVA